MKILRWILVLPAALAGGEIVTLSIKLLVQLSGDNSLIALMAPFANAVFSTIGFLLAGIYVAPSRRYETATILAALGVLIIVLAVVSMPGTITYGSAAISIISCFLVWKGYRGMHVTQRQKAAG
ncbi:MAG: hypothetical protein WA183_05340 [Chthoniobacterales bacterium]